ncbi:MAG: response regulator [Nitrospirae bacterium]|nr:response regulator [Nitrospirota bacterium]
MSLAKDFGETAKELSRNPLGIIALFIVLIYGFASLVVGASDKLIAGERVPLIWFLVISPFIVLGVFRELVIKHHTKLYGPSDYKDDDSFIRTAYLLGAASAKLTTESDPTKEVERATKAVKNIVKATIAESVQHKSPKTVLWVDDRPSNNVFERQALESLGINFVLSTSTEDAIKKVEEQSFSAIISDMGRPPDSRAGYTLLEALRSTGVNTPFFIYAGSVKRFKTLQMGLDTPVKDAGSRAQEHKDEARRRGAQGTTNRPDELFQMVVQAVGRE